MNKNKKVFKFQRKQILISNPLQDTQNPQHPQAIRQPQPPQPQPQSSQFSNYPIVQPTQADKLEMPKQMRLENIVNRLKSKFVAMMEADPVIKVDLLFQSEVVCKITGNVPKNNRESFGKNNAKAKNSERQTIQPFYRVNYQPDLILPFSQEQPNYLELLSQGVPLHSLPLKPTFESQTATNQKWKESSLFNGEEERGHRRNRSIFQQ